MHELESFALQAELAKGRRGQRQRMRGGTHVVEEAWQGGLFGPGPTAVLLRSLEDQDAPPGLGKCDGGHKSVRPGSDDDGVDVGGTARPWSGGGTGGHVPHSLRWLPP